MLDDWALGSNRGGLSTSQKNQVKNQGQFATFSGIGRNNKPTASTGSSSGYSSGGSYNRGGSTSAGSTASGAASAPAATYNPYSDWLAQQQAMVEAAAAAGVVAGDAGAKLEVLAGVTGEQIAEMRDFLATHEVTVVPSERPWIFDIQVRVSGGGHEAFCEIAGSHTNVICVERDGEVLLSVPFEEAAGEKDAGTDRDCLSIEKIVEFAGTVNLDDVKQLLGRQIACNMAIAREGLEGEWGANIGSVLLSAYGDGVANRAKAWAAAGSDARMGGCELPVVINSGSGNQGLTAP